MSLDNKYNKVYKSSRRKALAKDIWRSILISLGIALAIFVGIGVINDFILAGNLVMSNHYFSKMVLACVITACGFGIPTFVYNIESIPKSLRGLIHMGTGITIYLIVAVWVRWIPVQAGLWPVVGSVIISLTISVCIWLGFYFKYKKEAKEINEAIKNKNG